MKKATFILLLLGMFCFIACSKEDDVAAQVTGLNGSWKYIGYSGGFAGLKFTSEDTVSYFLQFDATRYTSIRNNVQGCGTYTLEKDTLNNSSHIGILGLSGENADKFDAYLNSDTLTLYPHNVMDGFSYHFVYSLKKFDWCDATSDQH